MEASGQRSGIRCNEHPDAPHGFMRDASHSAGRYVCECEFWKPQGVKIHAGPYGEAWIAQEEPVAHVYRIEANGRPCVAWDDANGIEIGTALYAAPLKREWIGLTEIEICDIEADELTSASSETFAFARAIEAKLKEKNT
jgi:hypothetical protein